LDSTNTSDWPAQIGQVVAGKYLIEDVIGSGGMGVVFRARHLLLDERVALKMPHVARSKNRASVTRFLREARSATRLTSDHVVRVRDVDAAPDGSPYLVMEYLEGRDLGAFSKSQGTQSVEQSTAWVLEACEALAEAHQLGIVHRDIKPSNLFLASRSGKTPSLKLLDFGIAHDDDADTGAVDLTRSNELLGSPRYMSPEQIRQRDRVGPRTDIWSLGVVLYELISAKNPFPGNGASAVLAAIVADPPRALDDVPAELESVILRCLAKEPDDRFPDVVELARALSPFAKDGPARLERVLEARERAKHVPAPTTSDRSDDTGVPTAEPLPAPDQTASNWGERSGDAALVPRVRHKRRVLGLGALVLVAGVAVVAFVSLRGQRTEKPAALEPTAPAVAATAPMSASDPDPAPTSIAEPMAPPVSTTPKRQPTRSATKTQANKPESPAAPVASAPTETPVAKPAASSPFAVDKTVDTRK
jgi:serine/threonine-protein kinase